MTGILNGQINFPLCLAPMVGLSHVSARCLVRRYTPPGVITPWPTEMLSSWRLPKEDVGSTPETLKMTDEDFLVPQILGNEEQPIAESVRRLVEWGAVGIDINMGCPVRKALRHNYGVALMGDEKYAAEIVAMTVRNSSVPVSVKLRAGLQNDTEYLMRFVNGLKEAGAAWITLHPRVGAQKRRGRADWSQIELVQKSLPIPIIGNGDIQTLNDIEEMLASTGCAAVMIGRALMARPWLMWQYGEKHGWPPPKGFEGQSAPATPYEEGAEYGRGLMFLLESLRENFDEAGAIKRFQFHLRLSHVWLEFGHALVALCAKAKTLDELQDRLPRFFESPQKMYPTTHLRQ